MATPTCSLKLGDTSYSTFSLYKVLKFAVWCSMHIYIYNIYICTQLNHLSIYKYMGNLDQGMNQRVFQRGNGWTLCATRRANGS